MKTNSGQASSTLIPEYIGSDFDAVLTVVDHINDIKPMAKNINNISTVANNILAVDNLVTNIDVVTLVADNILDVKTVSTNINDVATVVGNILNVNKVATDVGDVALVADNINYVKDVAEGLEGLPVSGYTGDTPPTQPKVGATWYCTLDGRNYTWYEDVDSGQWVESSPQSTVDDPHLAGNIFTLWKRSAAEAGYNLVAGNFEEGGVLTSSTDVLWHKELNSIYSWTGAYPAGGYVVAPGTDPAATPGYTIISDTTLRDDAVLLDNLAEVGSTVLISGVKAGVVAGAADALKNSLAAPSSTVSIAGLDAYKVKAAADNVRAVTIITGSGAQYVSAAQIGSSLLFTAATAVVMPTTASLGGVTGHYRIMAGSNPITLTRIDGSSFTVRGASVSSITIPAGSDCYVAYGASNSVFVFGLATYETIKKSYCLVNALGTGAPNELVSAELPARIAINSRYVLTNPFGVNVPVTGWVEVFYNNKWAQTGFIYDSTSNGYGVGFSYVQGEGIIIQTGKVSIIANSSASGSGHAIAVSIAPSEVAPCRVFIQKLGA